MSHPSLIACITTCFAMKSVQSFVFDKDANWLFKTMIDRKIRKWKRCLPVGLTRGRVFPYIVFPQFKRKFFNVACNPLLDCKLVRYCNTEYVQNEMRKEKKKLLLTFRGSKLILQVLIRWQLLCCVACWYIFTSGLWEGLVELLL